MNCINCQSENIQKLEVIYLKESKSFNSIGANLNFSGEVGITGSTGNISSLLIKKIAPPERKKEDSIYKFYYTFSITFFVISLISFLSFFNNSSLLIGEVAEALIFSLFPSIIGVIFYMKYKKHKTIYDKDIEYNKTTYVQLYKEWQNKWYCNKCGEIFEVEKN